MPDFSALTDVLVTRGLPATFLAAVVAIVAYRARSLTISGAISTTVVGGAVVTGAGWWAGCVLIAYFVSSSAFSRLRHPSGVTVEQARGKQRDAWQVLANGGVPALLAVCAPLAQDPSYLVIGCLGGIAAAAADTWATEIGRFSPTAPRMVTTWKLVPAGTSGAVSALGSAGCIAGAAFVALLAIPGWWLDLPVTLVTPIAGASILLLSGASGALADSLIGATIQERRWCPQCGKPTEQLVHRCGTATQRQGGWKWMNNDAVNATSIAVAAVIAIAIMVFARN